MGSDAPGCCVPSNKGWKDQLGRIDWPLGVGNRILPYQGDFAGKGGCRELAMGFKDANGGVLALGAWHGYIYTYIRYTDKVRIMVL